MVNIDNFGSITLKTPNFATSKKFIKILILCLFFIFNIERAKAENGLENQPTSSEISDEQAHYLVLHGTPDNVKKLIQSGYNVNSIHSCNTLLNTAIKSAAKGSQMAKKPFYSLEKIKILIDSGADINIVPCPRKSMSALNWAVSLPSQLGDAEKLVNIVIDNKIKVGKELCNFPDIVSKPCKDITPHERERIKDSLHSQFLIMNKKLVPYFMNIIEYLVDKGAQIDGNKDNGMGMSPIHLATMNPEEITLEPLKYLITKGANVNAQDYSGNTPLFLAYGYANSESVTLLINSGADVYIKNKDGALFNEVKTERMHTFINEKGNQITKNDL